jgi:hypothetical protein
MMVAMKTFDNTVMKIMSSKKSTRMIVCYFVANSLVLAEW